MVKVYAPASSANMSVGFDVLGAAVTPVDGALLGDVVTVEAAETFSLNNLGRFADKLPSEPGKYRLSVLGAFLPGAWQANSSGDDPGKEYADRFGLRLQCLFGGRGADGDE